MPDIAMKGTAAGQDAPVCLYGDCCNETSVVLVACSQRPTIGTAEVHDAVMRHLSNLSSVASSGRTSDERTKPPDNLMNVSVHVPNVKTSTGKNRKLQLPKLGAANDATTEPSGLSLSGELGTVPVPVNSSHVTVASGCTNLIEPLFVAVTVAPAGVTVVAPAPPAVANAAAHATASVAMSLL